MAYGSLVTLLLVLGILSVWFEFTAVAAVADTRTAALLSSLAAVSLALAKVLRGRHGTFRPLWLAPITLGVVTGAVAAVLLFCLYDETDIRFVSNDVQLSGTLFLPRQAGPHPAVVFIHGSGRQKRREFEYHAKLFARHGVAAFVYDKRGAGESEGSTYGTDYHGYAADAAAAIKYVQSRNDIRPACVGIVGHSEGGWVASIVASTLVPDIAFVVVTSTTPLSPSRQVLYETEARMRAAGFTSEDVDQAVKLQQRVLDYQRSGVADKALPADLAAAQGKRWFANSNLPKRLYPAEEYAWWRGVMDFDPVPRWRRIHAPVLAISGGRDLNSDVHLSHAVLAQSLQSAGNHDFTSVVFPNMEHSGIEWWLPHRLPPPRFPRGYAKLLLEWTSARMGKCL